MGRTNKMMITMFHYGAITVLLLALVVTLTKADDLFGYNEEPENIPGRQNARNRTPVYIPGKCGHNEILYPGDQATDWVCDCRPAHVYHPGSAGCFPLYTRAYCNEDEYVEIKPGSKLPQCTKNTCKDKLIPFNGTCVKLHNNNEGVCPMVNRIKYVVGVNEETLQLECISTAPVNLANRLIGNRYNSQDPNIIVKEDGSVEFMHAMRCAPGSAAEYNGTCTDKLAAPIPTQIKARRRKFNTQSSVDSVDDQ
ncbi:uncharacterized protein LOC134226987 [Armigeres subalbatus]|uniref:uncharacterized protein LOC134226987 n=1 Tax=Armigeres subalbatus TaxID=124917 RepID=UPI002ED3E8D1